MKIILYITLTVLIANFSFAQKNRQEDSLCERSKKAVADSDKVNTYRDLAEYYLANRMYTQGDSVLCRQVRTAQLTNDNDLILKAYFNNSIANINIYSPKDHFDRAICFINKSIDFASSIYAFDQIALGYTRLAKVFRIKGEKNKALENANYALGYIQHILSDSIKAQVFLELANTYHSREEFVLASKNYNSAYDIALKSKNYYLESEIYHHLAQLHFDLGDSAGATKLIFNSLYLNKEHRNREGILKDYFDLARYTEELEYIIMTISLADSLHIDKTRLQAKTIMFAYLVVKERNIAKTFEYLNNNPDLLNFYKRTGSSNFYNLVGGIYCWGGKPDSALYYYQLSKKGILSDFVSNSALDLYSQLGFCYSAKQDKKNAIACYDSALLISRNLQNLDSTYSISDNLSRLYEQDGDIIKALFLKTLAQLTRDTIMQRSKVREIALLDVEREAIKHEEVRKEADAKNLQHRHVRYMAITVIIGIAFILMFIIGMFPVSKFTIRMSGYFFFISLFEFLILLIETYFKQFTHDDPLIIWFIKIFLIAFMVPFQHYLEHSLARILESPGLKSLRHKFSIKNWRSGKVNPVPVLASVHVNSYEEKGIANTATAIYKKRSKKTSANKKRYLTTANLLIR